MKRLLTTAVLLLAACLVSLPASAGLTNNVALVLQPAAQTANTVNSPDQTNDAWRGGHFVVNVSSFTAGTYTPHIQGKDPISGAYYDILVGPAISATGVTVLKVYPGIGVVANGSAADILPQTWRVQLIGSSASMTISVSAYLEY